MTTRRVLTGLKEDVPAINDPDISFELRRELAIRAASLDAKEGLTTAVLRKLIRRGH